ncbi:putative peptide transporter ptr2-a protein [Zalerion maritima]|uniref:Peptide transporter ptr2-a protein n=1 Tax=Zalerion maritima TaxID=339359 RepID=A0AAD5RQU6_9PEZI|nr:putative peptide transporter ptr2-a protein [Zalerion maritima]
MSELGTKEVPVPEAVPKTEKDLAPMNEENLDDYDARPDHPSEEDFQTLRRVHGRIPLKAFTIAFIELCERFSYYGTIVVYSNFINFSLPDGSDGGNPNTGAGGPSAEARSGALGMGQRAAQGITTFNQFWQYFMPLFGAYVADEYWGRYKTISAALAIDILGHFILIISAIPPVITKPDSSLATLIIGILVIGFGTGGFKPNISPLIIEQLPEKHFYVKTLESGERVIVDPQVTINRVYNWFYMFINIGALVGQIGMVYAEKYVGFYLSFTLPTIMLCLCPAVMWWGRRQYDRRPPSGSVLKKAVRTFSLAQKGRWSFNPYRTWKNMHDGTFWEHVKPSYLRNTNTTVPSWMTFDDGFVDELRRGFAACAVFLYYPIYWLTYSQLNSNLTAQAGTMRLNGLPNDIMTNLDPFALIILIPICDFIIYPGLRKMNIHFTPIKRITAGFLTGAAAMVYAAVLQHYIYQGACGNHPVDRIDSGECDFVDINVWIQTPAYVLIALSEIFASITSLEYAYTKAPKSMRSMVQAVALFMTAISSALGEAFVHLSEDPLLIWNYGVFGVMAFAAGAIFWFQFRDLDREEDRLNDLPEGKIQMGSSDEEKVHPTA